MTNPNFKKQIDHIMLTLDFERVHRVMCFLNWYWWTLSEVPTIQELKRCAIELLVELCVNDDKAHYITTGGFYASKSKDSVLSLSFVLGEANGRSVLLKGEKTCPTQTNSQS